MIQFPILPRWTKISALIALTVAGLSVSPPPSTALSALKAGIQKVATDPGMIHGDLGVVVRKVETGELLAENSMNKSLLPASTMKTVTTAAALGILGEEYRFVTELQMDGPVENGVLKGNLIIKGGGDPTLGSSRYTWGTSLKSVLEDWLEAVRKQGIQKIEGQVIGDASIWEDADLPTTWVWSDIGNYYGAGPSGLTFHENLYYLYFKPGKVGEIAPLARTEPQIPGIEFVNEMKTGAAGSGDNGYVYGAPYTNLRYLRGSVPAGGEFSIKGSIPEPALFAAQTLHHWLDSLGIKSAQEATSYRMLAANGKAPSATRTTIQTHKSPALKDIVFWVNKKSVNLYAEHLLKACGYKMYKDGSTEGGAKAITAYWRGKGVDVSGLHMMDGSGLSRYNGITPAQMEQMLRINTKEPWFESFWNSLPIAGDLQDPGSLSGMCRGTVCEKNLRAKSGYISRVRTYTGYVKDKSGNLISFSLLANNYTCSNATIRTQLENLMVLIGELD